MNRPPQDLPATPEPSSEGVIPVGVAHFPLSVPVETRDYMFLLLPRFTLLAFSSAVEPLRIANQLSQRLLYRWRVVSQDGQAVQSSSGISVNVQGALGKVSRRKSGVRHQLPQQPAVSIVNLHDFFFIKRFCELSFAH